jgi:hypothetical protein
LLSGRDPSKNFVDKQIDSTEFIINISYHLHRQNLHCFVVKNRPNLSKSADHGMIHQAQRCYQLTDYNFVEVKSSGRRFAHCHMTLRVRERKGNIVDKITDVRQQTVST